jgi:ribosomal protein S18 acetylase RimI-like enzyme
MEPLTVCRLVADEWQTYRAIRLAMLAESPSAFGSSHDQAAGNDEHDWKQRLRDNVVLLARVGPTPAGSVMYSTVGQREPEQAWDGALFGMWVDPGFRGSGVGRALVEAVVAQAREAGRRRVVLHVVSGNSAATQLYERAGFRPTGRTVPYPHDDQVVEVEMELLVEPGSPPTPSD